MVIRAEATVSRGDGVSRLCRSRHRWCEAMSLRPVQSSGSRLWLMPAWLRSMGRQTQNGSQRLREAAASLPTSTTMEATRTCPSPSPSHYFCPFHQFPPHYLPRLSYRASIEKPLATVPGPPHPILLSLLWGTGASLLARTHTHTHTHTRTHTHTHRAKLCLCFVCFINSRLKALSGALIKNNRALASLIKIPSNEKGPEENDSKVCLGLFRNIQIVKQCSRVRGRECVRVIS